MTVFEAYNGNERVNANEMPRRVSNARAAKLRNWRIQGYLD